MLLKVLRFGLIRANLKGTLQFDPEEQRSASHTGSHLNSVQNITSFS